MLNPNNQEGKLKSPARVGNKTSPNRQDKEELRDRKGLPRTNDGKPHTKCLIIKHSNKS